MPGRALQEGSPQDPLTPIEISLERKLLSPDSSWKPNAPSSPQESASGPPGSYALVYESLFQVTPSMWSWRADDHLRSEKYIRDSQQSVWNSSLAKLLGRGCDETKRCWAQTAGREHAGGSRSSVSSSPTVNPPLKRL